MRPLAPFVLFSLLAGAASAQDTVTLKCLKELRARTSIEIRFSAAIADDKAVGSLAPPPFVIRPAVKGEFRWLSNQHGVFTNTEPLPLSTTFAFTLPPDLKKADGSAFTGNLYETARTPDFTVKNWLPQYPMDRHAPSEPRCGVLFNSEIVPAEAVKFAYFINDNQERIPARLIEQANEKPGFSGYASTDQTLQTWDQQFQGKYQPPGETLSNALYVRPERPLHAAKGWVLALDQGLPAPGGLKLFSKHRVKIGEVAPFEVASITPNNALGARRTVVVTLNKAMADEVKAEDFRRWVTISPEPAGLEAQRDYPYRLVLTGDFQLKVPYEITVKGGFPAKESSFFLMKEVRQKVTFEPLPAQVALEAFDGHQLASGNRKLRIHTVNVPAIRVTAKRFEPDTLIDAETAYGKYQAWGQDTYPHRRVEEAKLPGRLVFSQDYAVKKVDDRDQILSINWDEIVGAGQTGAALVTVEAVDPINPLNQRAGAQALIQLTDLGVVWKDAAEETFAYVFSMKTGKPVGQASVQWLDEERKVLVTAQTAADGTVRLPANDKAKWLLVSQGSDLHAIAWQERDHIAHGRFRVQWDGEERMDRGFYAGQESTARQVFIFSDRPVYKPGETLHLKAMVRDDRMGKPRIPAGEAVTLELLDAQGKSFLSRELKWSDAGSLAVDVTLPSAPLGAYEAILKFAGQKEGEDYRYAFRVEQYVPNAFEVSLVTPSHPVGGQELELELHAKYYMGKPLSKAKLSWSLVARDEIFAPAGWEGFTFGDHDVSYGVRNNRTAQGETNLDGEEELEEGGVVKFGGEVPLDEDAPQPRRVEVRGEVTDINQQTVTNTASFVLQSSDFYLGLGEGPDLQREGENFSVRVAAVRPDGTPMPEPVAVKAKLHRVKWQTNRRVNAGYADSYDSTMSLEEVAQADLQTTPVVQKKGAWVFAEGSPAGATFPVAESGEYLIELTAEDAAERPVTTVRSVYVYGQGATVWNYRNPLQIELTADQDEYVTGQTATLLVKTPISGEALVTVERQQVTRSFVTRLEGNAPSVKVPLEAGDAPNVYVSVMLLRGADDSTRAAKIPEYRVGYAALKVRRPEARLSVYAKPAREQYEPGQEVELRVEVRDGLGVSVPKAEVTLYAVDEGVLSLMSYRTPDPFGFYNQRRALGVETGLTLPTLMSEDEDVREAFNKGYLIGDGGEENTAKLRKNFIACAYWNASLVTDEQGHVSARFTAPDSLTRYRVMAVVHTAKDQFGHGDSAFEINKPVMVEAAPPRFGNVGDHMLVRAVIHNSTEQAGEAEVKLVLDATASSAEPLTRRVELPAKASLAVDFPVEFKATGEAVWKWSVDFTAREGGARYRDAMESRLAVSYPSPSLRQVLQQRLAAGESDLLGGVDRSLLDGVGTVQVRLSNSRLLEMREGLDQLLHYPYGCVEQTTSSTLPWLALRELGPVLPGVDRPESEVKKAIQYGVNRLFTMQTAGGGLAYWPGETEPLLYASAWGGFGIAWARKAGVPVPEADFDRLMKYLSTSLRTADPAKLGVDRSSQCMALFTLAVGGRAEPAYHERFFQQRASLDAQQRAWLALAILEANGDRAMVKTLLGEPMPPEHDRSDWWTAARTPAVMLMAWCRLDESSSMVDRYVTELLASRRRGHWYTTQGNAWAVIALGDYAQRVEKVRPVQGGELIVDGERIPFELGGKTVGWSRSLPLQGGVLPKVKVVHRGESPLFTDVTIEVQPRQMPAPRMAGGYSILRQYQRVEDDGTLTPAQDLKVGDRILVTLEVNVPARAEYLAIEDPLPANLEAINPNFATQAAQGQERVSQPWSCDFHELRTDRALFFVNQSWAGRYQLNYLARVRAAGTATAPPAKVEEMYEPDRFATTTSSVMKSAKWD